MSNNIEIKARVTDSKALLEAVLRISDSGPEHLTQRDIFYRCPFGRLKLRSINDSQYEIIYYIRSNQFGPKNSTYFRKPVRKPWLAHRLLKLFGGVKGVVEKQRTVYFIERTRIHLDSVSHLGEFLELEVVMSPHERKEQGMEVAEWLKDALGIEDNHLIEKSYLELLGKEKSALTMP